VHKSGACDEGGDALEGSGGRGSSGREQDEFFQKFSPDKNERSLEPPNHGGPFGGLAASLRAENERVLQTVISERNEAQRKLGEQPKTIQSVEGGC